VVKDFFAKGYHSVDKVYARQQCGSAMLGWPDKLYRANDASCMARARELYKGVMILHGDNPQISPTWGTAPPNQPDFSTANPQIQGQVARARCGFMQIEKGLNYSGYSDDLVVVGGVSV
jgi:hypothetical protein